MLGRCLRAGAGCSNRAWSSSPRNTARSLGPFAWARCGGGSWPSTPSTNTVRRFGSACSRRISTASRSRAARTSSSTRAAFLRRPCAGTSTRGCGPSLMSTWRTPSQASSGTPWATRWPPRCPSSRPGRAGATRGRPTWSSRAVSFIVRDEAQSRETLTGPCSAGPSSRCSSEPPWPSSRGAKARLSRSASASGTATTARWCAAPKTWTSSWSAWTRRPRGSAPRAARAPT